MIAFENDHTAKHFLFSEDEISHLTTVGPLKQANHGADLGGSLFALQDFLPPAEEGMMCQVQHNLIGALSLIPRPHPAFHRLQYRKAWRTRYLFSREHDIIGKWQKFSEQTGCVLGISQLTTHSTLGI